MIDLIDAKFEKGKNTKPVNFHLEKGITYFCDSESNIFSFFDSKKLSLFDGKLVIDGIEIIPYKEDNNESLLYVLAINSKEICLHACFSFNVDNGNENIKNIESSLLELRDFKISNDIDKISKITRIFEILKDNNVIYVTIDMDSLINFKNENLIKDYFKSFDNSFSILIKDNNLESNENKTIKDVDSKENIKTTIDFISLDGEDNSFNFLENDTSLIQDEKPIKNKVNYFKKANLIKMIKTNWIVPALICLSSLFCVLFSSIIVYATKNKSPFDVALILIVTIASFFISIFVQMSSFDFINENKENKKEKFKFVLLLSFLFSLIGASLGFLLFFVFYWSNFIIKASDYNLLIYLIPSYCFAFIILVCPFFAKPFYKVVAKFKKKKLK